LKKALSGGEEREDRGENKAIIQEKFQSTSIG